MSINAHKVINLNKYAKSDNICGKFGKAKSVAIYGLDTEKTNVVMFMQS